MRGVVTIARVFRAFWLGPGLAVSISAACNRAPDGGGAAVVLPPAPPPVARSFVAVTSTPSAGLRKISFAHVALRRVEARQRMLLHGWIPRCQGCSPTHDRRRGVDRLRVGAWPR